MTITLHFPLPAKCLTMNQRLHWAQKAKLTRAWRGAAMVVAIDRSLDGFAHANPRSVVELTIPVRSVKIRRDPSNFYPTIKAVVDGLVDAGLWPDDTSEYVVTVEPRFKQGGDVEVRITPASEWVAT